ncbi:hypothetical protein [Streptomyces botrytidirepellens]|uniref:Uncharacterized protein n=1 Tax=Streptomyces botrytidirepellens TaxID=2486417 RepID=A0A3M8XEN9_9ACTN|nr:hypothetical protein [Streptomyces botrytidirepellens]RNG39431.1 hypothetical protein EEJ42_00110 [Streptomyces botrytidirepellens]
MDGASLLWLPVPWAKDTARSVPLCPRGRASSPLAVVGRPCGSTVRYSSRYASTPYRTAPASNPLERRSAATLRGVASVYSRLTDTSSPRPWAAGAAAAVRGVS